ncbi:MAG: phosphotransferase family protein [Sphingobium sp.]
MQPTSGQILHSIRRTIRDRLGPVIAASDEAAVIAALDVALSELIARESRDVGAQEASRARLIERGRIVLGGGDDAAAPPAARLQAMIVEAQRRMAGETDADRRSAISAWTTDVVQWQYSTGITAEEQAGAEAGAVEDAPIDQEVLASAISRHLASGAAVSINGMSKLSGGYSRDTFLADWSADGMSGELVIRRQKAQGMLDGAGIGLDGEFPLLQFAHQAGLPMPQAYWTERLKGAGGPYIVMEKSPGGVIGTAIDASSVSDEAIRAVATTVAHLHQVDWRAAKSDIAGIFGLKSDGLTIRMATQGLLDRWEKVWAERNLDPSPALAAAFQWLRQNVPERDGVPCLLHGDIGFHNILFDGDRIAALLDWEMAYLGDPAKDMAACEAFISRYGRWDDFVRCYRQAGGPPIDEAAQQYYHVLRVFTHLLVGEMGWQTCFADLDTPPIEAMFLGGPIRMHFFADYLNYLPLISGATRITQAEPC